MSALLTSVSFFSLRMRPGALVPIKWRLPECPRLILPFAVNLKRFLAPRWAFNFNFGFDAFLGIAGNPLDNLFRRLLRRGLGLEGRGYPVLAKVGPPPTALSGPTGAHRPATNQNGGRRFLTDDGRAGAPQP